MKIVERLAVWLLWAFLIVYGIPSFVVFFIFLIGLYIAVGIIAEVVSPKKRPFYF